MLTLDVNIPGKEYKIYIGENLCNEADRLLEPFVKGKKVCIVSDTNVFPLYGNMVEDCVKKAGGNVFSLKVEAGEESKCFKNLEYLCREIIRRDFTRSDVIIALGGGVVGDLAALCASVVLRGVTLIQMPTTLLSQVDSSVGGKTAVNIPEGKNLVGTFYQPKAVIIDTKTLATLPERELACGMAEVIKYGAIRDKSLADKLMTGDFDIEDVIYTCCDIKRKIVENDELDKGERMLLNFGHTLGHAVENYTGYGTYSHGAAVSIGMCCITAWSEKTGITQKGTCAALKALCEKYGLPTHIDNLPLMVSAALHDKKRSGNMISVVLIKGMGDSFYEKIDVALLGEIAKEG